MKLGEDIIIEGIKDLAEGKETVNALLVAIGAPRLRMIGLPIPDKTVESPEIRLYLKLSETAPNSAHSRYNALIRRLVSFERAAEGEMSMKKTSAARKLDIITPRRSEFEENAFKNRNPTT